MHPSEIEELLYNLLDELEETCQPDEKYQDTFWEAFDAFESETARLGTASLTVGDLGIYDVITRLQKYLSALGDFADEVNVPDRAWDLISLMEIEVSNLVQCWIYRFNSGPMSGCCGD